jgi:LemA protein
MSNSLIFFLVFAAIVTCWAVGAHNRLMQLRNAIGTQFQALDTHLKERHKIIYNMADLAISDPELDSLSGLTKAACQQAASALDLARRQPHTQVPITSLGLAEQVLDTSLTRLLEPDTHPNELQTQRDLLTTTQAQLIFTRQLFNTAVVQYNSAVRQFPANLLCLALGFKHAAQLPDTP